MKSLQTTLILIFLSACSSSEAPSQQWEMAVQGVYSACLSNDAQYALIGSVHHGGSFWQVNPAERLYDWNHKADAKTGILSCALSRDGRYASTAEHRKIVLWNAKTGEAFWLWEAPANIRAMKLTNDGSLALLGMDNYEAALFDIQNGGVKQRLPHEGVVQTVDISDNARWGITGGDDSLVKIWEMGTGKEFHAWRLTNQIKVVAISANGKLAFAASHRDESIIWDTETKQELIQIPQKKGFYTSARFNDAGDELLTGSSSGHVMLWQVETGHMLKSWQIAPPSGWVNLKTQVLDVAFAPDGYRVIGANGVTYELK